MRRRGLFPLLALAAVALSLPGAAFARAKTDLVFLTNGDRLTGEIKQLDRGILKLSTDGLSTVNIEWDDVDSLNSVYHFRVEDSRGGKHFGAIFLKRRGTMEIIMKGVSTSIPADSVVVITPLEASFWSQLDGSISVGYSYTKANSLSQLTSDIWIRRRTSLRQTSLDWGSTFTRTEGEDRQLRYDLAVDHRRYFEGIYYGQIAGGLQRNDELGLDLRTSAGAGLGANLVRTNRSDLNAAVGVSVNREWADDDTQTNNFEGVISGEHAIFGYDSPKVDYSTELTCYVSFTDWGRVRLELDVHARREIVSDLFVDLSFYDSYDNRPPGGGEKSDYGLVFSLGYTF